jgi:hypothetical protein
MKLTDKQAQQLRDLLHEVREMQGKVESSDLPGFLITEVLDGLDRAENTFELFLQALREC